MIAPSDRLISVNLTADFPAKAAPSPYPSPARGEGFLNPPPLTGGGRGRVVTD